MKAKDVNPYDLNSVATADRHRRRSTGPRETFRRVFGGIVHPPRKPPPTITHDELVTLLADKGFLGVPTDRPPSGRISTVFQSIFDEVYGPPELSPELIRRLPDRAQCAFQSAMETGDNLTRWLCVQLAHALFEKDRYKKDFAETGVKLFNCEERLDALEARCSGALAAALEARELLQGMFPKIVEPDPCDACTVEKGIHQGCPPDCEVLEEIDGV